MKNRLARQLTFKVAACILGGMLIYAAFQYLSGQGGPVELIFRHVWHTAVLGGLIYVFLILWLRSALLKPINQIAAHANQLSKGVFQRWNYTKSRNEIDQVTSMMNRLADHLNAIRRTPWRKYAETIESHLESLRDREDLSLQVHGELVDIRDSLLKMDVAIMGFVESLSNPAEQW